VHAVLRSRGLQPEAVAGRLRESGFDVQGVETVPASLEDVFLDVVEKAARS
jgi:hypothetical protein